MSRWVVGVDVGGTFTDFSARNPETGAAHVHKRPSTPDDPSRAILEGLAELKAKIGADPVAIDRFAHGTTVATNALLERRGARVAVVTTKGFRDLLEIGRQIRPKIYDLFADAPAPLAERADRLEAEERIGPDGGVVVPLSEGEIERVVGALARHDGIEAVAVLFLFSFLNPEHEQRMAAAIRAARPDLSVSTSSDVQPEFREYERFSTTLVNAFLQPVVGRYMDRLAGAVADAAPSARFGVFQSSGGLMSVDRAARFPVRTALSGPAAGAVGAAGAGARSGFGDLITLDMGGTSTDVALIRGGTTEIANVREIAGFRIRLPMVDIHTVGAGGGSIARVGPDGLMKVGPESAGAVPGPACYGKGGTRPTVSDANVVLGRLPASLAGGGIALDRERAAAAVGTVADALGVTPERAALGIVGIVNSNMARAIRAVSTERGHDPRAFTLMPFGGAGGLHAAEIAASLRIGRILVPLAPGILCAEGLIEADLEENYVATLRIPLDGALGPVEEAARALSAEADRWLAEEAAGAATTRKRVTFDMRYVGQNYELPVLVCEAPGAPAFPPPDAVKARFLEAHRRSYGHADEAAAVEIVNVRVKAVAVLSGGPGVPPAAEGPAEPAETASVFFEEAAPVTTPVWRREALAVGATIAGPAILTQFDATTLVPPGARATVDGARNILMEIGDA